MSAELPIPDPEAAGTGARLTPRRLLLVTGLYPTPDLPIAGTFVAQRVSELRRTGVDVEVVAAPSYRGLVVLRYLGLAVDAIFPRRRVDGVEGHVLIPTGVIAMLAAARLRVPCVVYAHGADVWYTAWRNALLTLLAKAVVRRAIVITNSRWTATFIERLGGSATVISPGVDLSLFRPGASERSALDLPDGPLALYVGNRLWHKGADLFVGGVLQAAGWRGLMVGGGPPLSDDPRIITRPPVQPQELVRYLRSVDCVVIPSRREPLGLAAIEAAAVGVPIVASTVGGLAETIHDGVNGVALEDLTPAAVARSLVAVAARPWDPELVRSTVLRHDVRLATQAMAEVWRSALASSQRR